MRWGDYEVSSDAFLEGQGHVALWTRVNAFRDHGMAGYYLRVDQDGRWELGVANTRRNSNNFYTEKSLATGQLAGFKADAWHKLAVRADGNQLQASIDGNVLVNLRDNTYACGAVGYSTWAEGIQKDYEDMHKAMVIGMKYGQARYDNLLVRAVPGKLMPVGWKASASSEHVGNEAEKVFDLDPATFWHSEYGLPLPQSLTLDLGRLHQLREVRVLQRRGGINITRYALSLSEDGKDFTTVSQGAWADDTTMKVVDFAPRSARFVRVEALEATGKQNYNVTVAELQFLETE